MTKKDFVLKQPASMTAQEVVKRAKAKGLKMSVGHVYVVRAKAKKARGGGKDSHARLEKRLAKVIALLQSLVPAAGKKTARKERVKKRVKKAREMFAVAKKAAKRRKTKARAAKPSAVVEVASSTPNGAPAEVTTPVVPTTPDPGALT